MSTGRLRMPDPGAFTSNLNSAPSSGWILRISWLAVGAPPAASKQTDNYRVVPGDNLVINVFEKPELSRNLLVPPDGKITYPFLGELKVSGLTLEEIRQMLTLGLKKQLASPQVSIELAKRLKSEVSILGVVRNPGKQPLEDGWHLLDLISASGGMSSNRPELTRGTLVRGDGAERIPIDMDKLMSGDPEQNRLLQPGDTFLIREQEARNFSMMIIGEVNRPGLAEVPKSGSFFEMFAGMGGFKPGAAVTKARLTRKGQTVVLMGSSGRAKPRAVSRITRALRRTVSLHTSRA